MGQTAELPPRTARQVRDDRVRAVAGFAAKAFEGFRAACLWHGWPVGGRLPALSDLTADQIVALSERVYAGNQPYQPPGDQLFDGGENPTDPTTTVRH